MIWNEAHTPAAPGSANPLDGLPAALGLPAAVLNEVTRALSAFGAAEGPLNAPGWHLARALWSVGEHTAAHTVAAGLLADGADEPDARRVLEQSAFDPRLGFLLEARVLRPLRWQYQPEPLAWVLDFGRLQRDTAGHMALFCLRGLQDMLAAAAGVWDDTAGRGALALKGWPAPQEAEDFCRAFLERCRHRRGWAATPRVLQLR